MKNPWTKKSDKTVYDNPWIEVIEHQVITPGGSDGIYGVVRFKTDAIAIIPLDQDLNTWIVGQYRYPTDTYEWEVPEGGRPFTEDILETAKRELAEEVGLSANKWTQILEMQLSNSTTTELSYTFIAEGLTMGDSSPEECEDLSIRKLPFEEVYQMVLQGEIKDALSVASILKAKIWINENRR